MSDDIKTYATTKEILDFTEGFLRVIAKAHEDFLSGEPISQAGFKERCAIFIAYKALARTFDVTEFMSDAQTYGEILSLSEQIVLPTAPRPRGLEDSTKVKA